MNYCYSSNSTLKVSDIGHPARRLGRQLATHIGWQSRFKQPTGSRAQAVDLQVDVGSRLKNLAVHVDRESRS